MMIRAETVGQFGNYVMSLKGLWQLIVDAGTRWSDNNAPRLGAALAYYAIFSIAPLLVIVIAVAGALFGRQAAEGNVTEQLREMVGPQGADSIQAMIASASRPGSGITASVLGFVMLL